MNQVRVKFPQATKALKVRISTALCVSMETQCVAAYELILYPLQLIESLIKHQGLRTCGEVGNVTPIENSSL